MADDTDKLAKRIADRIYGDGASDLADEALLAVARRLEVKWKAMVERDDVLRVFFAVVNNRLDYTYSLSTDLVSGDPEELSAFLIRAVQAFGFEPTTKAPEQAVCADGKVVHYDYMIEVRWAEQKIVANFPDEQLRLQCLSFIVEDLRKKAPKKPVN